MNTEPRTSVATHLAIDSDLVALAMEVRGEPTKKAVVTTALREFIARRRQKRLIKLFGKLERDTSFDHKSQRSRW